MLSGKLINQDRIPPGLLNQTAQIPWYDSTMINDAAATANNSLGTFGPGQGPRVEPGDVWQDVYTGNIFQYVKAGAALQAGAIVQPQLPTTGTVTAAGSTVDTIITNITTTASEVGNFIWFYDQAVAGKQSLRVIKGQPSGIGANTSFQVAKPSILTGAATSSSTTVTKIFDPDVLAAVPTNGSACIVFRPWVVIPYDHTVVTTPICGVALGTVTSGNFTIIQIGGLAMVLGKGDVTAITAPFAIAVADTTTDGFIKGGVAGTVANANQVVPLAVTVAGDTAAAKTQIPCLINMVGVY